MPNLNAFESACRTLAAQRVQQLQDARALVTNEVVRDYFADARDDLAEAITPVVGRCIYQLLAVDCGDELARDAAIGGFVRDALRNYVASALLNRALTEPDPWSELERRAS